MAIFVIRDVIPVLRIAAVRRQFQIYMLLFGLASGAAASARAGESECYNDWSEAAAIVEHENLVTVDKLTSAAKATVAGEIVKTTLCKENGKYVFRLVVRDKGALKTVTVDAQEPFKK